VSSDAEKFGELVQYYRDWLNQDPSPEPAIRRRQEHFKAYYGLPWSSRFDVWGEQNGKTHFDTEVVKGLQGHTWCDGPYLMPNYFDR
jgi:hypothetical protein